MSNKYSSIIALQITGLCLFFSCDKNSDDRPSVAQPACRPTSIMFGALESKYEYNTAGQLIKFTDGITYIKYEYADGKAIKLTYYRNNDEASVNLTDLIEYNANGQWIKHSYTVAGTNDKQENTAQYDGNGNRIKIITTVNGKSVKTYTFEYSNGNLTMQIIENDLSYTYEYDLNHENELTNFESLVRFGYTGTQFGMESTPSKYMLKKVNTFLKGSPTHSADFHYEYNTKGFPTKLEISGGDLNGDGQVDAKDIYIWTYQYDCQ